MTITEPLRLPVEVFQALSNMENELFIMQFREQTHGSWETLGTFNPELAQHYYAEQKKAMYMLADGRVGYLRVLRVVNHFSRPTQKNPKRASDDCHTYS